MTNTADVSRSRRVTTANLAVTACVISLVALSSLVAVDNYAEAEFDDLFGRALVSFALARTLNGVISAVQGTEVALQPAGVGVTLTPGEILDPVNDLIEQFSWIMLGATISLGIQQVLLDFGQWWVMRIVVGAAALLWLVTWLVQQRSTSGPSGMATRLALRAFVVVIFLRFAVPATLVLNDAAYDIFLEERYTASIAAIESAGADLGKSAADASRNSAAGDEASSFIGRAWNSAKEQFDLEHRLDAMQQRAADLVMHLVQLGVVFVLQTVIFPLLFLWILLRSAGWTVRQPRAA